MEHRRALLVFAITFLVAVGAGAALLVVLSHKAAPGGRAGTTAGQDAAPARSAADLPPAR